MQILHCRTAKTKCTFFYPQFLYHISCLSHKSQSNIIQLRIFVYSLLIDNICGCLTQTQYVEAKFCPSTKIHFFRGDKYFSCKLVVRATTSCQGNAFKITYYRSYYKRRPFLSFFALPPCKDAFSAFSSLACSTALQNQ